MLNDHRIFETLLYKCNNKYILSISKAYFVVFNIVKNSLYHKGLAFTLGTHYKGLILL